MSIEEAYANLTLEDEEAGLELEGEDVALVKEELRSCLIGHFLTQRSFNVMAMKNTLASLWRPVKGVCIKDLPGSRFIFQFFHPIDMNRVLDGGPWTFDQHLLILKKLEDDENPSAVELNHVAFWVQVNDIPVGFMSERVAKHISDFMGTFLSADPSNFTGVFRSNMRIRVLIDVRQALKRKMKIKKPGGEWIWFNFQYERLSNFCFICGKLDHTERFCERLFSNPNGVVEKPYGSWLRAPPRRSPTQTNSKWLRATPPENPGEAMHGKEVTMELDKEGTNRDPPIQLVSTLWALVKISMLAFTVLLMTQLNAIFQI